MRRICHPGHSQRDQPGQGAADRTQGYSRTAVDSFGRVVADVYPAYNRKAARQQRLDFDDLIGCAVKLLHDAPSVRGDPRRFRHLLVDEFQDINHAQYAWMRLVAGQHGTTSP